ncbi:MAG: hypothetical protein ACXWT1_19095 [Methylobacter sp.]
MPINADAGAKPSGSGLHNRRCGCTGPGSLLQPARRDESCGDDLCVEARCRCDNRNGAIPRQCTVTYKWYAGRDTVKLDPAATSNPKRRFAEPVEYGAINLMPSDRIKQTGKGAVAAMIIEPLGSTSPTY